MKPGPSQKIRTLNKIVNYLGNNELGTIPQQKWEQGMCQKEGTEQKAGNIFKNKGLPLFYYRSNTLEEEEWAKNP